MHVGIYEKWVFEQQKGERGEMSKARYITKTVRTEREVRKLVSQGWEVAASGNAGGTGMAVPVGRIFLTGNPGAVYTLRKPDPKYLTSEAKAANSDMAAAAARALASRQREQREAEAAERADIDNRLAEAEAKLDTWTEAASSAEWLIHPDKRSLKAARREVARLRAVAEDVHSKDAASRKAAETARVGEIARMARESELTQALHAAHASGDTRESKRLAKEIRTLTANKAMKHAARQAERANAVEMGAEQAT